jgi:hypothetical protein
VYGSFSSDRVVVCVSHVVHVDVVFQDELVILGDHGDLLLVGEKVFEGLAENCER